MKHLKVSVIGLGYMGSGTAVGFTAFGDEVLGIDIDEGGVTAYRDSIVSINEPELPDLFRDNVANQRLYFFQTVYLRCERGFSY